MTLDDDMQRFKPDIDASMILRNCNECEDIILSAFNGERELECYEVQRLRLLLSEIAREAARIGKRKAAKIRPLTDEEIREYIDLFERKMTCICTACESLCFESDKYCANCGAGLEGE